jgi:hypothetical protein
VTSILRALGATSAAALLVTLSACAGPAADTSATPAASEIVIPAVAGPCEEVDDVEGVTVIVDASALGDADEASATWCVPAEEPILASEALDLARIGVEGTEEYGDQVVCRVDGVPAEDLALTAEDGKEYFETCASMPAAFAYWSLWVRPAAGEWAYAEEGLSTLELEPGESLALLFTLNGEPASP